MNLKTLTPLLLALQLSAAEEVVESLINDFAALDTAATATYVNESYMPYNVSVFRNKELELLGIANLEEALSLMPGLDIFTNEMNDKEAVMRGSNPYAFGQTKLFVDGVLVNNILYDSYKEYMSLPVELIKRIEVVRGPGAEISVFNPYAGAIRVVTYAENIPMVDESTTLKFFAKGGSNDTRSVGALYAERQDDFFFEMDMYYYEDDLHAASGLDAAATGRYNIPALGIDNTALASSGEALLGKKTLGIGLKLEYQDFYLKARTQQQEQNMAYGRVFLLPDATSNDYAKNPNSFVEVGYENVINDFGVGISAGARKTGEESSSLAAPAGFQFPGLSDPTTVVTFPDGIYVYYKTDEREFYQNTMLSYTGFDDHEIMAGYRISYEETANVEAVGTNRDTGVGIVDQVSTTPPVIPGSKRTTISGVIGDHFTITKDLSLIASLNVEKNTQYDNVIFDPKASLVYAYDSKDIFKIIYSSSHRNPSWQELYTSVPGSKIGNPDLNPERVDAYEIAYIRLFGEQSTLKLNAYYLDNRDQILQDANGVFENYYDSVIYGMETEFDRKMRNSDIYINFSYTTGESSSGEKMCSVANYMMKGYYALHASEYFDTSLLFKYIGQKSRSEADPRIEPVASYFVLDATLNYHYDKAGFGVVFAIKNLFDEDYYLPSAPYTYADDYRQPGRAFLLTVKKEF